MKRSDESDAPSTACGGRPSHRCAPASGMALSGREKERGKAQVKTVEAGVIGVGWIGGLRADTLSRTALVDKLHLCDIKPDRLTEVKKLYKPAHATPDY